MQPSIRCAWRGWLVAVAALGLCGCEAKPPKSSEKSVHEPSPAAAAPAAEPPPAAKLVETTGTPTGLAAPVAAAAPGVAADGFPTGQETAEGVACDMARAFINADGVLFKKVCYPQPAGTEAGKQYNAFIDEMVAEMARAKTMPKEQAGGPKEIAKVYRARNLSRSGPASFGYAVMRLIEVKFVDVDTPLWTGRDYQNRTLVVQDEDSKVWYAIPRPDLFPMLSTGLNGEADSTELWKPPTP